MEDEDREILKKHTVDFVSFSYYMSMAESADPKRRTHTGNTVLGLRILICLQQIGAGKSIQKGLKISLIELYDRYQVPLMIVENGMGAVDQVVDGKIHDPYRIDYFKAHFQQNERSNR